MLKSATRDPTHVMLTPSIFNSFFRDSNFLLRNLPGREIFLVIIAKKISKV